MYDISDPSAIDTRLIDTVKTSTKTNISRYCYRNVEM